MDMQLTDQIRNSLTLRKLSMYPFSFCDDRLPQPVLVDGVRGADWVVGSNAYGFGAIQSAEVCLAGARITACDSEADWARRLQYAHNRIEQHPIAISAEELRAWCGGLHWDLEQPCGLCHGLGVRLPRDEEESDRLGIAADELMECTCSFEFDPRGIKRIPSFRGLLFGSIIDRIQLPRLLELFSEPVVQIAPAWGETKPLCIRNERGTRIAMLQPHRSRMLPRDAFEFSSVISHLTKATPSDLVEATVVTPREASPRRQPIAVELAPRVER